MFNNLRASRVTELDEAGFNAKTLDAIFGNTESIRNRHYVGFRRDRAFMLLLSGMSPVAASSTLDIATTIRELIAHGGQTGDSVQEIIKDFPVIETGRTVFAR